MTKHTKRAMQETLRKNRIKRLKAFGKNPFAMPLGMQLFLGTTAQMLQMKHAAGKEKTKK